MPTLLDSGDSLLTVRRGLQVLHAFRGERSPLSNAEIVARTGLPKSTVSRLTTTLIFSGFLRHAAGGRQFELDTGSLGMGHAYLEASPVVRLARPFLQSLADQHNVSVALAIHDELDMLYLAYCSGKNIATLRLGVGSMLPMATTAIGRAYLWGLSDPEREAVFVLMAERFGDEFGAIKKKILVSFAELESTGTCLVKAGYQRDTYGISLPIKVGVDQTVMSLSCGAALIGADFNRARTIIGAALKSAAPQLEHLLKDVSGPC